jgi:hypothetical protein
MFEIIMTKIEDDIFIEYTIKPYADVNIKDGNNHTALNYACQDGLNEFVHKLLAHGARAQPRDMLNALEKNILTTNLADKMIQSGVDCNECFYLLAKKPHLTFLVNLTHIIGLKKLNEAISKFENEPVIVENLKTAEHLFTKDRVNFFQAASPRYSLSSSVPTQTSSGRRGKKRTSSDNK